MNIVLGTFWPGSYNTNCTNVQLHLKSLWHESHLIHDALYNYWWWVYSWNWSVAFTCLPGPLESQGEQLFLIFCTVCVIFLKSTAQDHSAMVKVIIYLLRIVEQMFLSKCLFIVAIKYSAHTSPVGNEHNTLKFHASYVTLHSKIKFMFST